MGREWGAVTRLSAVQPSGLVGLGYGVGFNLNGGLWDSLSAVSNRVGDEGKVVI